MNNSSYHSFHNEYGKSVEIRVERARPGDQYLHTTTPILISINTDGGVCEWFLTEMEATNLCVRLSKIVADWTQP